MSRKKRRKIKTRTLKNDIQRELSALNQIDLLYDQKKKRYVLSEHRFREPVLKKERKIIKYGFDPIQTFSEEQRTRKERTRGVNDGIRRLKKEIICNARKVRKGVIFAKKLRSKGSGAKRRKITEKSKVRC